jgi:large subunit ribosomal protein L18
MSDVKEKITRRHRRHRRVRRKIEGRTGRPRLAVFRSIRHIYGQLIDDDEGRTLAASSTLEKSVRGKIEGKTSKTEAAGLVGADLAEKARSAGIESVVFDRGGFRYHGRVKALAEAARKGGLKF